MILILLHGIYFEGSLSQFEWLTVFLSEIMRNLDYLFSGNWVMLTHLFRSLLFFVLLGSIVSSLHFWFVQRQQVLVFYLLTIVYITFLDTFTPYDARTAIIRTVLTGFVLMGILTFQRIYKRERLIFKQKQLVNGYFPYL